MQDILNWLGDYGGTFVMAGLFVYVFLQDRRKNTKLLEDNAQMLEALTRSNNNIAKSNDNIAESLTLMKENMITIDRKIDRNYEANLRKI